MENNSNMNSSQTPTVMDKEKAEKLAAAKRRVEQMKKKKNSGKKECDSETLIDYNSKKNIVTGQSVLTSGTGEEILEDINLNVSSQAGQNAIPPSTWDQISSEVSNEKNNDRIKAGEGMNNTEDSKHTQEPVTSEGSKWQLNSETSEETVGYNSENTEQKNHSLNHLLSSESANVLSNPSEDNLPDVHDQTREFNEVEKEQNNSSESQTDGAKECNPNEADTAGKEASAFNSLFTDQLHETQTLIAARQKVEKECFELRARLTSVENENSNLRTELEKMRRLHTNDEDNDELDKLEDEKHEKLMKIIRDLEQEVLELRRESFREPKNKPDFERSSIVTSPGTKFTEVDLGGGNSPRPKVPQFAKGGLGNLITSGLNAITGANTGPYDDALLGDDELMDFDEEAFKEAQKQEANWRIEKIKNTKRALKNWEGWRLDLVELIEKARDEVGPVFEI